VRKFRELFRQFADEKFSLDLAMHRRE